MTAWKGRLTVDLWKDALVIITLPSLRHQCWRRILKLMRWHFDHMKTRFYTTWHLTLSVSSSWLRKRLKRKTEDNRQSWNENVSVTIMTMTITISILMRLTMTKMRTFCRGLRCFLWQWEWSQQWRWSWRRWWQWGFICRGFRCSQPHPLPLPYLPGSSGSCLCRVIIIIIISDMIVIVIIIINVMMIPPIRVKWISPVSSSSCYWSPSWSWRRSGWCWWSEFKLKFKFKWGVSITFPLSYGCSFPLACYHRWGWWC